MPGFQDSRDGSMGTTRILYERGPSVKNGDGGGGFRQAADQVNATGHVLSLLLGLAKRVVPAGL
jgi:hypothetical protein